MASNLTERDWENPLRKITGGKCVPFLGAGACYGALPLGGEIAREWAQRYHYPMSDSSDLVRVSQFLAVEYDLSFPKELVLERLGINPATKIIKKEQAEEQRRIGETCARSS
jgi:hypothetical protein